LIFFRLGFVPLIRNLRKFARAEQLGQIVVGAIPTPSPGRPLRGLFAAAVEHDDPNR
jgi:hypothetical protein